MHELFFQWHEQFKSPNVFRTINMFQIINSSLKRGSNCCRSWAIFQHNYWKYVQVWFCCNPSIRLVTKAKGLQGYGPRGSLGIKAKRSQGCGPRKSPAVTSHIPGSVRECKKVWGNEPSHSWGNSHFGRWSPSGLSKFRKTISGATT
jgi:hypothetical protein